jgi:hypothetical protein
MSTQLQIGFSQRIRLAWLEHTAQLVLAGQTREQIERELQDLLRDQLSVGGNAVRGNREKAITILLRTWVSVSDDLKPLRDDGVEHLQRLPPEDHLAVHWGMSMTAYPFFGAVAEATGRLLRLQGSAAAAQVQRRIREQLGERETVARAARRVLRCFLDWGVLEESTEKGVYRAATVRPVEDRKLAVWLVEAALVASSLDFATIRSITQSPALFPFSLVPLRPSDLSGSTRLEPLRQGVNEDMIALRTTKNGCPPCSLPAAGRSRRHSPAAVA